MDDDALLKRIDRRLEVTEEYVRQSAKYIPQIAEYIRQGNEYIRQGNEYIRQGNEYMRRGNEYMQEARAAGERHAQAVDDQRTAINQWNLRQEKMMREVLAELHDLRKGTQEMTAGIREWRYEGVEEARAQRAALFAILDQLKGGGPATA
jgi:methyl-accepting chemotaxis protein